VTRHLCDVLGVRFYRAKLSEEMAISSSERRVIYLCNHRSWADFFMDQAICGGASYLARYMVVIGTPVSSLFAWMSSSTWFFNRKRGLDRQAFFRFMEASWDKRPDFGMIAYPEGTRK
jgi:1-acyl-sn-glycerol-3-phosphate acyltransferase